MGCDCASAASYQFASVCLPFVVRSNRVDLEHHRARYSNTHLLGVQPCSGNDSGLQQHHLVPLSRLCHCLFLQSTVIVWNELMRPMRLHVDPCASLIDESGICVRSCMACLFRLLAVMAATTQICLSSLRPIAHLFSQDALATIPELDCVGREWDDWHARPFAAA